MARPYKDGIDYFNIDIGFMSDIKTRKILKKHGGASVAVLMALFTSIYGDKGYFVSIDEDTVFLIADDIRVEESYVLDVIASAVDVGMFDDNIYRDYHVLTSRGIQKRYLRIVERRNLIELIAEYVLVDISSQSNVSLLHADGELMSTETELMSTITPLMSTITPPSWVSVSGSGINADDNPQRKEKKRESKEKEKEKMPPAVVSSDEDDSSSDSNLNEDIDSSVEKKPTAQERRFNEFWEAYPEKKAKGAALKAWQKLKVTEELKSQMIDAIDRQKEEKRVKQSRGEFCPNWANPSTWLNQERWLDEVDLMPSAVGSGQKKTGMFAPMPKQEDYEAGEDIFDMARKLGYKV